MTTDVAPFEELGIEATLDANGIKGSVKSRTISAIDRLGGNFLQLFVNPLERVNLKAKARNEIEEQLIRTQGEAAIAEMKTVNGIATPVLKNFMDQQNRKYLNKSAIAAEAVQLLIEDKSGLSEDIGPVEVDADWINLFEGYAENASSEKLRNLWSKILAGEIRNPGAFSLSTMRIISELDKNIAELFERVAQGIMSNRMIAKPELKGQTLFDYCFLEEIGLLNSVNGSVGVTLNIFKDGYIYFQNDQLWLQIKSNDSIRLNLIQVTRAGKEVASILPKADPRVAIDMVVEQIKDRVETIDLCIMSSIGLKSGLMPIEKIK